MARPRGPAKLPFLMLAVADYSHDTIPLSEAAEGLYIRLLVKLHDAPQRGQLRYPEAQWITLLRTSAQTFRQALTEYERYHICTILRVCPAQCPSDCQHIVQIKQRRMLREEKQRQLWRKEKQAQREK